MSVRGLLLVVLLGLGGVVLGRHLCGPASSAPNGVCPVCETPVYVPRAEKMTPRQREVRWPRCPCCGVESPVSAYFQGKADADDPVAARERAERWRAKVREDLYQAQEHYVPAGPEGDKARPLNNPSAGVAP